MSDPPPELVVPRQQIVGQADHHLARDGPLRARDEPDPVRREARRQHGDFDDERRIQLHLPRGLVQDLAPGEHIGAGQVETAVVAVGQLEGADQRCDDVVDADRLRARAQPRRQHHQRQSRRQIADNQPAEAAVADDHAGAELDRRDGAGPQRLTDGQAAAEVRRGVASSAPRRPGRQSAGRPRGRRRRRSGQPRPPRVARSPSPRPSREPGTAPRPRLPATRPLSAALATSPCTHSTPGVAGRARPI